MPARRIGQGFRSRPLSMTPLIDIIFLLLLFFMLSSTFAKFSEIELISAGAGQAQPLAQTPVFVRLKPESLSLNGRVHSLDNLVAALAEMRGNTKEQMVLVSLDDAVSSQRLVDLLAALRLVEQIRVQVLGGD